VNEPGLSRRDELLADGALGWLDGGDDAALDAVLREPASRGELHALERTAAIAACAFAATEPTDVQRLIGLTARLHADGLAFCATRAAAPERTSGEVPRRAVPATRLLPWVLAAAALVFAVWSRAGADAEARPVPPSVARGALLRAERGVVTCALRTAPTAPRGGGAGDVDGDVVWDAARQEGYLRLRGLPVLDPQHRYQLWIVDAAREGPPVDGGLLPPLATDEEAVVRIDARLPVQRAAAFVLTRERAHGVVVSAQEHVVAIAKP
jgi:hypothetical protein